jgi:hypothetical protein
MCYGSIDCPGFEGTWHYLFEGVPIGPDGPKRGNFQLGEDGFIHVRGCRPEGFFIELYALHWIDYAPVAPRANSFVFVLDTTTNFYLDGARYLWKPGRLYDEVEIDGKAEWTKMPLELEPPVNPPAGP